MNTKVFGQYIVIGLCVFIACLNFKPSDPYLSEFLICNKDTETSSCSDYRKSSCDSNSPCFWSSTSNTCSIVPCANVSVALCGNSEYDYCELSNNNNQCQDTKCYKHFSADQVNNEIYPWSTFAYLPFLLLLGPFAELYSYRIAILCGVCGRVVTRFLLLFGTSLLEMQLMQVVYSLGTAAEDVFAAYIYYVVPPDRYQSTTSYVKASALLACVVSGVLGDLLVVEARSSLTVLMWISAVFVCVGVVIGLVVLRTPTNKRVRMISGDEQKRHRRRSPKHKKQSVPPQLKNAGNSNSSDRIVDLLLPKTSSGGSRVPEPTGASGQHREGSALSPSRRSESPSTSSPFDHARSFYGGSDSSRKLDTKCRTDDMNHKEHQQQEQRPGDKRRGSWLAGVLGTGEQQQKQQQQQGDKNVRDADGYEEYEDDEDDDDDGDDNDESHYNIIDAIRHRLLTRKSSKFGFRSRSGSGSSKSHANSHQHDATSSKLAVFTQQMMYLGVALKNRSLLMMLMLWVVGNAVYTVLYNYEVSIYGELHGSNEWNGCVLAIMLLVGSLGAMAPAWLKHDRFAEADRSAHCNSGSGGDGVSHTDHLLATHVSATGAAAAVGAVGGKPVSERVLALRLSIMCVVSSVSLLLFVGAWKTIPSVAFLSLFFGAWQYVNVTVYSRLALQLKAAQISHAHHSHHHSGSLDSKSVSFSDVVRTLSNEEEDVEEVQEALEHIFDAPAVKGTAGSGESRKQSSGDRRYDRQSESNKMIRNIERDICDTQQLQVQHQQAATGVSERVPLPPLVTRTDTMDGDGDEVLRSRPSEYDIVDPSAHMYSHPSPSRHSLMTVTSAAAGGGTARPLSGRSHSKDARQIAFRVSGDYSPTSPLTPLTTESIAADDASTIDTPDPPYSIAIVSVIALNVIAQIAMQAVLFSWLQLSLRQSCLYLVLIFCAVTVVYLLYTICCFGCPSRRRRGGKDSGSGGAADQQSALVSRLLNP